MQTSTPAAPIRWPTRQTAKPVAHTTSPPVPPPESPTALCLTMLPRFSHLIVAALAACSFASASPSNDAQVRDFLARDPAVRPLTNYGRRSAATTQTRHLRPDYSGMSKRDSSSDSTTSTPDIGQIATWTGQPEPERDGKGDTFLSKTNSVLDAMNPDNVAAPPTDAGEHRRQHRSPRPPEHGD